MRQAYPGQSEFSAPAPARCGDGGAGPHSHHAGLTLMKATVSLQAAQGDLPAARELVAELRAMAVKHLGDG